MTSSIFSEHFSKGCSGNKHDAGWVRKKLRGITFDASKGGVCLLERFGCRDSNPLDYAEIVSVVIGDPE